MDLQDFYDVLFQSIHRIAVSADNHLHVPLLLSALHLTLYDLRQLSSDRVAGFCKRLLSLAVCLQPHMAIPVLSTVRLLFTRYPKARRLVDVDHACVGVYNPALGNAELSNALASTAFELSLLRASFHPHAGTSAREIAAMATESNQDEERLRKMISTKSPEALLRLYDSSAGGFNPPIRLPLVHPLRQLFEKRIKKRIKGQDMRAIELFVEQPKPARASPFLRALSGHAPDACVSRGVQGKLPSSMSCVIPEMAPAAGGRGLFASSAMTAMFRAATQARHNTGATQGETQGRRHQYQQQE